MEYRRTLGKSLSFSSSEASSSSSGTFQKEPYKSYILQDPSIKLTIPGFNIIANYEKIVGNDTKSWEINLISLRRGLLLLRILAQLNDPGNLEWISVIKIIKIAIEALNSNTKNNVDSVSRWSNIAQYLTRSRRFITWLKVCRALEILANEFPYVTDPASKLHDQIKELLTGQTRLAKLDSVKWDEELRKIPNEKFY
jgi:hypothetical protein